MYIERTSISNLSQSDIFISDLTCPVCNYIMVNPVQCNKCDNCFCEKCVYDRVECPKGCGDVDLRKSIFMKRILSKLKFTCKNGCNQQLTYNDLENHYLTDCRTINYLKEMDELKNEIKKLNTDINKLTDNTRLKLKVLNVNKYNLENAEEEDFYVSKYHPHPLIKDNTEKREEFECKLCMKKKSDLNKKSCFYCEKCEFDLCEQCIQNEKIEEKEQ